MVVRAVMSEAVLVFVLVLVMVDACSDVVVVASLVATMASGFDQALTGGTE